jgi:DivIVA domain-containing protein
MDGTPHLLTDVKFSERRRGYDPEEVDNFLERVSGAVAQLQDKLREVTARAEDADGRIAEAQRAKDAAEAELAKAKAGAPSASAPATVADPEADAEKASKILLMAQRTADATIEDANETAQKTVAEASEKAKTLVAAAEAEALKLRTDAKREADQLVEQRRTTVVREVRELEDLKTSVKSDIDILGAHVDEQRARIRRGVEALALVLDDPEGLRVDTLPELEDRTVDTVLTDAPAIEVVADEVEAGESVEADDAAAEAEPSAEAPTPPEATSHSSAPDDVVVLDESIDVSGVDLTAAPEPSRAATGGIFGAASQSTLAGQAEAAASPDIDLSTDTLFGGRDDKVGPPTQSFKPFGESEDPLGPTDDEADKAMRAFFETDFDSSDPQDQKSRFGFRR